MGFLKVNGTIDLDQFWPEKESDGDTIHVIIEETFLFQPYPNQPFQETSAFDNAEIGHRAVLHVDHGSGAKSITVRVEGIDAPNCIIAHKLLRT